MPHKEDFDDDNYESIEEKEMAVWSSPAYDLKFFFYIQYFNV